MSDPDQTIAQARAVLSSTPPRWSNLAETLPAELLARRPAPDQWSARDCLQHMIDVERVYQFRLQCFLDGQDFPGFDPDMQGSVADSGRQAADLAAEFTRLRADGLAALLHVRPQDLDLQVRHQELGPVTLREFLNTWAAHDLNHTVQAERSLMQPFIAACGPWQSFFTDHIAGR